MEVKCGVCGNIVMEIRVKDSQKTKVFDLPAGMVYIVNIGMQK